MLKEHNRLYLSFVFFFDILVIILSWLLADLLRASFGFTANYPDILVVAIIIHGFIFYNANFYKPRRTENISQELKEILKLEVISLLALVFYIIYFRSKDFYHKDLYPKIFLLYFYGFQILFMSLFRVVLRNILRYLRKRGHNLRYALLVGSGKLAVKAAENIKRFPELGIHIKGVITSSRFKAGDKFYDDAMVLSNYDSLREMVEQARPDQVIFALDSEEENLLKGMLNKVEMQPVDIRIIPDIYNYFSLRYGIEELEGMPVINLREIGLGNTGRLIKRVFDLIFSGLALIIFFPLFLFIAILIKLGSRGPVFYVQKRMGLNGMIFDMYKFRTMIPDAEAKTGPVVTEREDKRITRIGRYLRKSNLDELPQLFNVFIGQMSLVGPRPERLEFSGMIKEKMPTYMFRYRMKSGMTGLAQIRGYRGGEFSEERLGSDLEYINNWSLGEDVLIILKTIFLYKNAY
ncbi:MAG: exopolysaccharide biosynthesis polyprenyl glycosylphosphotransferase [Candidatus Omnitrophica bacterium]|nr:exopolysaccharide biosynthesis polyprenyl glycosylphosphotransferase [Candidatus Omnitrophota bacterium]MDD5237279.1 exopolysaccharide biosynthesis polyprenyl glycosylphosphotransferase [Candidatus Omnitrophota bacterium]MDD5610414.1 exopolysaccharide biosynthesis polyprenyl glycosylphosphotransferase [Candidatus Omnitrophota bacterium]